MRVRVLFYGQLKEITGVPSEDAELSDGARVEDLFERYGRKFPKLAEFRTSIAASVNQEYAGGSAQLTAGEERAFLRPARGGGALPGKRKPRAHGPSEDARDRRGNSPEIFSASRGHRAPAGAAGNRRDQRVDRGDRGAPRSGVRCLSLRNRHAEARRAHLEEGILRWRCG